MNIYFTASIAGKKHYLENYRKIISILKDKGHQVVSDHIINSESHQILLETKEQRLVFQEQLNRMIKEADCVIAETSFPSISVGYEISLSLHKGKPVLMLYSDSNNPPSLLAHHKDEKLICERYSPGSLKDIIEDFLCYTENAEGIRFTFFLSSDLNDYLTEISRSHQIPKAVYIRKLIQEDHRRTEK